ncbi:fasciclin domain-containing protein [Deinococcus sp.]|uniref:fasciclin domain-containing protein n=1 Tax=Deinococcus sp. TaxID=47478 RepID=UPI0025D05C33|nr:fasciclin domain-containing protein [Deinococcus sp.]
MSRNLLLTTAALSSTLILGFAFAQTPSAAGTTTSSAAGGMTPSAAGNMTPSAMSPSTMSMGTIADIVSKNPDFSTLLTALKAAGLDKTLAGKGPFTVFAPTNAAFAKVPKATLTALLKDKAALTKVLTYHVVAGSVKAADVVKLKTAKTVEGSSVKIAVMGSSVMIDKAKVTKTDIVASNGVIHVIDTVLMPAMK